MKLLTFLAALPLLFAGCSTKSSYDKVAVAIVKTSESVKDAKGKAKKIQTSSKLVAESITQAELNSKNIEELLTLLEKTL